MCCLCCSVYHFCVLRDEVCLLVVVCCLLFVVSCMLFVGCCLLRVSCVLFVTLVFWCFEVCCLVCRVWFSVV